MEFLEYTVINNYDIKLKEDKLPPFGLIYILKPVKLETLKSYIEINIANGFILLFKFLVKALIFLD